MGFHFMVTGMGKLKATLPGELDEWLADADEDEEDDKVELVVQIFYGDTPPNDPEELEETFLQRFPRCSEFDKEFGHDRAEGETEERLQEIHLSITLDAEGVMEAIATQEKRLLAFFEKRYQEYGEEVDEISFDYCF